jgi:hypothetical protein
MPVRVNINGEMIWLYPSPEWKTHTADQPIETFAIDQNFLVLEGADSQ